jgi:SH3-like domain-containing protein
MSERAAMRFTPDTAPTTAELRVVRYAVAPLLDRPDEVLGMQVMDLIAGDEVQVTESTGPYWEVVCPNGERGWIHRTTLSLPGAIGAMEREPVVEERVKPGDAEDALTALLAARGLN